MKKAYVQVEYVHDCPDWLQGECNHPDNKSGNCNSEYDKVPPYCPLEDA